MLTVDFLIQPKTCRVLQRRNTKRKYQGPPTTMQDPCTKHLLRERNFVLPGQDKIRRVVDCRPYGKRVSFKWHGRGKTGEDMWRMLRYGGIWYWMHYSLHDQRHNYHAKILLTFILKFHTKAVLPGSITKFRPNALRV